MESQIPFTKNLERLPWKYFVLAILFSGMRSVWSFLLLVFWLVCGGLLAESFFRSYGIPGFCLGLVGGTIAASFFSWLIHLWRRRLQN